MVDDVNVSRFEFILVDELLGSFDITVNVASDEDNLLVVEFCTWYPICKVANLLLSHSHIQFLGPDGCWIQRVDRVTDMSRWADNTLGKEE